LTGSAERLPGSAVSTWIVLAPAVGLVLIGALFVISPQFGAAIFGVPAAPGSEPYLIAIGLRDVAFGLYVLALAVWSTRRAVGLVLAITVLIPVGDIWIVAAERGWSSPMHLLLHAVSGTYMAAAAWWTLRDPGSDVGP
jgi:Domain of unknown function (DUF4267)